MKKPKLSSFWIIWTALFISFHAVAGSSARKDPSVIEANKLAGRVLGERAGKFIFEKIPLDTMMDAFEIASCGEKILIRGSSSLAMVSGLNWYLKNYCHAQFTDIDEQLNLPEKLPLPSQAIHKRTPYRYRYFFNTCTFSYTMAWWGWKEWERQIDWMAMNGINFPLAITGQEEVWYMVYKELGLTDAQINDFFAGPAYLPWGWMGNIDGFGGPVTPGWRESHQELQKKILSRERALGMKPVLQGFSGHVPAVLTTLFPNVKIHKTGNWSAGFGGTWFLDPAEELFGKIGRLFIEKQTALYGTDHYYSADSFNEVDPDSDDPVFLANMSRSVYRSMADADPEAIWVIQAWFLYYQKEFWKEPQTRAFFGAVPDDKMVVLDLWGERFPVWETKSSFYGKPWIWNVLSNFGGRTSMNGNLPAIAANLNKVIASPDKGNFSGIGMTMEYFGNNPVVEEYVMDRIWNDCITDNADWIRGYAHARYSSSNRYAEKAWLEMLATVYGTHMQNGTFFCERPGFFDTAKSYRSNPVIRYSQDTLILALKDLLGCSPQFKNLGTYQFDLVNLTRQVLSPLALTWIREVENAYVHRDPEVVRGLRVKFLGLITDLDRLLSTRKEYLSGRWIESAKSWGTSVDEKDLYEWNAKNLITLWGKECTENQYDDLNNYALKQWSGVFMSYHLVRWTRFFDQLESAILQNKEWDRSLFYAESCEWEKEWSKKHDLFPTGPEGDPVATATEMWNKYKVFFIDRK